MQNTKCRIDVVGEIHFPPPPDVVGSPIPEGAFRWDIRPLTEIT